jgi:hypothetical protein
VFGKRVLTEGWGLTREWRALLKEELHVLCLQQVFYENDQMEEDVMGGKCSIHKIVTRHYKNDISVIGKEELKKG